VLLLGTLVAAGIELTGAASRREPPGCPRESAASSDRAQAIGALGEALVGMELHTLEWPVLSNVVIARPGWSAEIDHLVRAPDGIVIIETKTLSGVVWGQPGGRAGRSRCEGRFGVSAIRCCRTRRIWVPFGP
jgi:hypothetical protein